MRGRERHELDPLARVLIGPAPGVSPLGNAASSHAPVLASAPDLVTVEEVVRRIAWGGDRRRGVARIELGSALGGAAIVVRGEGREISVSIELARGSEAGELPALLLERLRARGLEVTSMEVR